MRARTLLFPALAALVAAATACTALLGDFDQGGASGTEAGAEAGPDAPGDSAPREANASDAPVEAEAAAPIEPNDPVAIVLGEAHACAILENGQMFCWGKNQYGETGAPAVMSSPATLTPQRVPWLGSGPDAYAHATAGTDHTCAVDVAGSIWCFGANYYDQLGNRLLTSDAGTSTPQHVINDVSTYVKDDSARGQIYAGHTFTCANLASGSGTWCWGFNEGSLNGADAGKLSAEPVQVPLPNGSSGVAIGTGTIHGCVSLPATPPAVWCWGGNKLAQLGDGTSVDGQPLVQSMWPAEAGVARALVSGIGHNCAMADDGNLYCWGFNGSGQTGQPSSGPNDLTLVPTSTAVFSTFAGTTTRVAAGGENTCIVRGGAIYCIGENQSGQLGIASSDPAGGTIAHDTPGGPVTNIDDAIDVAVGGFEITDDGPVYGGFACAIRQNATTGRRTVWCWGANDFGQLGKGTMGSFSTTPVQVVGLPQ